MNSYCWNILETDLLEPLAADAPILVQSLLVSVLSPYAGIRHVGEILGKCSTLPDKTLELILFILDIWHSQTALERSRFLAILDEVLQINY